MRRPGRGRHLPSFQPPRRRIRIEPSAPPNVLRPIHDDVHERSAHFAGRRQRPRVVTITPDTAPALKQPIDSASDANRSTRNSTRQTNLVARLDEQMYVINLDRKVNDTKPIAR